MKIHVHTCVPTQVCTVLYTQLDVGLDVCAKHKRRTQQQVEVEENSGLDSDGFWL